ncbi:MAG: polysaccharide biosynthesis tyrosine autokinase [Candidatus Omnitrophica bacterium]|nr:polysaccharide biosynthesis tyrosine autokinase [Candidatus Omnitrophota bacterium]
MIPPSDVKELSVNDYLQIIGKRVWIVIATVAIVVGFVSYKNFTSEKLYDTRATVLVSRSLPSITGKEDALYHQGVPVRETQIILLESNSLAERVLQKLNLNKDPEYMKDPSPARKLRSQISIEQVEKSDIISIVVRGNDPLKITSIANAWAEEFISADLERRTKDATSGIKWLQEQLEESLKKLQKAEMELNDFLKNNKIVSIPEVGKKTEFAIDHLKNQKVNLEKELIESLNLYKEKHPKIIEIQNQLKAVEIKLKEESDKMFELQEKTLEFKLLSREVGTHKDSYEQFRDRIQELDISRELTASNIQIVDQAQPPSSPYYPNPQRDISMALVLSLAFSIGVCYFIEYLDSTLKSSEDVELYTKMPFLGYTPAAEKEAKDPASLDLISHSQQFSQTAEAFRNVRVSLLFVSPEDNPIKSFVLTSSIPQEGKSFVAINLATAFAAAKEPTILIDADMRKGRIAHVFNMEGSKGITSVLAGMCSWEEAVVQTQIPNLFILPRGTVAPNPVQLLNSEKLSITLREVEQRYKRVIIDAPPILSVADALILGAKAQGLLFVIKAESTSLNHILEAKKLIEKRVQIIGAVLNGIDVKKDRYYYYHYSYYNPEALKKT